MLLEESKCGAELVVIGAYNGSKIEKLVRSTAGKIILVEPVKNLFFKLKERFQDLNNITYCNYGVSSTTGIKDFYRFNSESIVNGESLIRKLEKQSLELASFADELGSLREEHIKSHYKVYNVNPDEFNIKEEIQFFSFEEFIYKNQILNINSLQIDTEGHDYDIINSIPFDEIKINELIFEWKHLDGFFKAEKKCEDILEYLASYTYKLEFLDDENIRAYKTQNS